MNEPTEGQILNAYEMAIFKTQKPGKPRGVIFWRHLAWQYLIKYVKDIDGWKDWDKGDFYIYFDSFYKHFDTPNEKNEKMIDGWFVVGLYKNTSDAPFYFYVPTSGAKRGSHADAHKALQTVEQHVQLWGITPPAKYAINAAGPYPAFLIAYHPKADPIFMQAETINDFAEHILSYQGEGAHVVTGYYKNFMLNPKK